MLSVELDIFSGRPNPTWALAAKEEQELVDRIMVTPSLMLPLSAETGGLGYRGYIITSMSEDDGPWSKAKLPSRFRLGGSYDKDTVATLWLLDTSDKGDSEVDDYLRSVARDSISHAAQSPGLGQGGFQPEGVGMSCARNYLTSSTDFGFWNGTDYYRYNNNCYNFASNYRSNTFAQPGLAGGHRFSQPPSCSSIPPALAADGWAQACLGGTAQNISACLVIWPGNDFHFYRLCASGRWCHKPGHTAARNTDNSGRYITNPETCNRGPYTIVCGYWYANSSVRVQ